MKDERQVWYDANERVAVTLADVTSAAQALARGHLNGPTSAYFQTRALAAVALLGDEIADPEETVSLQVKCAGPLGGINVECTAAGTLRGYTEKKILDDFDGLGQPDARKVLARTRLQVTRSVPGRILAQGISNSLDGYLAGSLQRRAFMHLQAAVTDDVEIVTARGMMVEALPDASPQTFSRLSAWKPRSIAVSPRNLLKQLGLERAEMKRSVALRFACRCSAERAQALLAALPPDERATLPPTVDIACHLCGRIWTVKTS